MAVVAVVAAVAVAPVAPVDPVTHVENSLGNPFRSLRNCLKIRWGSIRNLKDSVLYFIEFYQDFK